MADAIQDFRAEYETDAHYHLALVDAYLLWRARAAGRDKPRGYNKLNERTQRRSWQPDAYNERAVCCDKLKNQYMLHTHCKSVKHISHLKRVRESDLRGMHVFLWRSNYGKDVQDRFLLRLAAAQTAGTTD